MPAAEQFGHGGKGFAIHRVEAVEGDVGEFQSADLLATQPGIPADQRNIEAGVEVDAPTRLEATIQREGADTIAGPYYSPVGRHTGVRPTDQERAWAVEGLRALGEHAEGSGIILAIEPLNRFETYFINTMEQSAALTRLSAMREPSSASTAEANRAPRRAAISLGI